MSRIRLVHSFSFCVRKIDAYTIRMPQPCMLRLHKLPMVWRDDATMKLAIFP